MVNFIRAILSLSVSLLHAVAYTNSKYSTVNARKLFMNRFLLMKAYDYNEAAFHVKQVKLILNGDKVKLMGARAEYNSVEDLLHVKAFRTSNAFQVYLLYLYFKHYSKTELPFKPRTVLTNICLLTRCNLTQTSRAIFRYLIMTIMTRSTFRAQHPAMRGIRDLFHWMSSEEEIEALSVAASRMTPSGLVYR